MLPNHQLYKQNFSKPYNCTEQVILKIQYSDEKIDPLRKTLLAVMVLEGEAELGFYFFYW